MPSPSLDSSGLDSADGRLMSTPPCIMGAVIMKMTSNSSITSIRLTTFTSALSSYRCRRRWRRISDFAFADEQRDHRGAESFQSTVEAIESAREDVVAERGRDRDGQRRGGRGERLADAGCHGRQVARPL